MAAKLRLLARQFPNEPILAVVGAGHLAGISKLINDENFDESARLAELDHEPPASRWPKMIPWAIIALIIMGFVIGFSRSPELGMDLIVRWVLINGTLAAIGAMIAAAHPITWLVAFIAAPFTSLNPTISAGIVAGTVELFLRKPNVDDFANLRTDTTSLRGWWHNRAARILVIVALSTLGSAAGTYLAGIQIYNKLF